MMHRQESRRHRIPTSRFCLRSLAVAVSFFVVCASAHAQMVRSLVFDSDQSTRSELYRQDLNGQSRPINGRSSLTPSITTDVQEPQWSMTTSAIDDLALNTSTANRGR